MVFLSKIFHPNVYGDGRICLDILDVCYKKERKINNNIKLLYKYNLFTHKNNWSPVYDVYTTLLSLQSLLTDPNPRSPANPEAARYLSIYL